jgi:ribose/xylose/arabinose/galactoside ABC-type transport system permease subunit
MTVPDPDHSPEPGSRFPGEGFRVEPDFRYPSGEAEYVPDTTSRYPVPTDTTSTQRVVSAAELDDVFDDPEHGEPGRDRLGVHWVWETLLLISCVAMVFVVANGRSNTFSDANLRSLMVSGAVLGALALAAGMSLRVGAVNLAIGPTMVISGLYFAQHLHNGFTAAFMVAIALATGIGLVIGAIVIALHVPSWAVSLAALIGLQLWIRHLPLDVQIFTDYHANDQAYYWFGSFVLVAVIGGVLGAVHSIRRSVGRFRPIADPADRRGTDASVITILMLAGSGLFAGLAGVAAAVMQQEVTTGNGLVTTGLAIGVALVAGTSAFGRRGGIFGTVLATIFVTLLNHYFTVANLRVDPLAVVAGALAIGLIITRVVESAGRPQRPDTDEASTSSWLRRQQGSWTDQLPARTTDVGFEASDERWGTRA